ncbi:hypothetical protein EX30DRAFT_338731 [Ascodesmis nigricans]|uniref:Calcium-dependent phosphotriesterase n=1 Tax=Ascodesmis nigricans TaxID=341454 RepID=A0A4S2N4K5_9PEZI|nr:hypothetical protein EX30DRAFT_338731 [Ascodesmis nigricans]
MGSYTRYLAPTLVAGIAMTAVLVPHYKALNSVINLYTDFTETDLHLAEFNKSCTRRHPDILTGCEDMYLHGSTIYAACQADSSMPNWNSWGRLIYTPGVNQVPGDKLYKWDLDTDVVTELELRGFPQTNGSAAERSFLGMDVNVLPNGKLSLYVINLLPIGNVIDKFSHDPSTNALEHVIRIPTDKPREEDAPENKDPAVPKYPNSVFALPELDDEHAIFVSNDHYYEQPWLKLWEYGALRPTTWLSYYSKSTGWKLVRDKIVSANGVTGNKEPKDRKIYVAAPMTGLVHVLQPKAGGAPYELEHVQDINVKMPADNPKLVGDDLWVPGLARGLLLDAYLFSQKGALTPLTDGGPGMIIKRVNTNQLGSGFFGEGYTSDPVVETIVVDGYGKVMNVSSTAWFKPYEVQKKLEVEEDREDDDEVEETQDVVKGDLYVTGIKSKGILVCKNIEA